MEIHQLRYFTEVAHQGSFTRAAAKCNVTQPTLSHQILKLESELGELLIHRRRPHSCLTPFGKSFYPRAMRILNELRLAQQEADSFTEVQRGVLAIGAIPTIAPYLLPGIVGGFLKEYPSVQVKVAENVTENLLTQLKTGDIDFALVSPPLEGDDWEWLDFGNDELLVTLPEGHVLAQQESIGLDQLMDQSLVLMREAHCLSRQALSVCSQVNRAPAVAVRSSQLETVQALVEMGLGISFTPAMAVPYMGHRRVQYRSIAPQPVHRRVALAWFGSSSFTQLMERFVGHVKVLADKASASSPSGA